MTPLQLSPEVLHRAPPRKPAVMAFAKAVPDISTIPYKPKWPPVLLTVPPGTDPHLADSWDVYNQYYQYQYYSIQFNSIFIFLFAKLS